MTKASLQLRDSLGASTPHRGGFHFNKTQELLCRNVTAFYLWKISLGGKKQSHAAAPRHVFYFPG